MSRARPYRDNQPIDVPRNPVEEQLAPFLNKAAVKAGLGIPADFAGNWRMINQDVFERFNSNGDWTRDARLDLDAALEADSNLRVLLYAGDTDVMCNFLGIKAIANKIQYEDQLRFRQKLARPDAEFTQLVSDKGKSYGNVVDVGRVVYARIYGAGHMVNENKPKESKELFEKFVGDYVFEPQEHVMGGQQQNVLEL